MQIIIVGCGNVGGTLAEQLSREDHNITVIDTKAERIRDITERCDVMGINGNGAIRSVQMEAGVEEADLLIAVTDSDELNLLCCLIAKKAGRTCQTIARVRNPHYSKEAAFLKDELGLAMVINPELAAAFEIARLLKYPKAIKVETFAKGRAELLKFRVTDGNPLVGCQLKDIPSKLHCDILICTVERGEDVAIPDGNFTILSGDLISVVSTSKNIQQFFRKMGMASARVKNSMIIGGGSTSYYLAKQLLANGIQVKIVEKDKERCRTLCDLLPEATIILGDGTDRSLLMEEGIESAQSFIAMTSIDEENIMLSLYAKMVSQAKLVTKVHRISYNELIGPLDLGSVIYPKYITAENIIRYVRALSNSMGSNVETLYKLIEDKAEALEFYIRGDSPVVGVPLQDLNLKSNILIAAINHNGTVITPGGQSRIYRGDTVVVITTRTGLHDIRDILQ